MRILVGFWNGFTTYIAETYARNANNLAVLSNFRFGTVLEDRYAMLLPVSGNDHNAREALNNEVEGLFPDIDQSTVRRKIKRARVIYEIFNEIGVDKVQYIESSPIFLG